MTSPCRTFALLGSAGAAGLVAAAAGIHGARGLTLLASGLLIAALLAVGWRTRRREREVDDQQRKLAALVGVRAAGLEQGPGRLERARQQLLDSGGLATLGALAAGAAHEINDPLSVALSNLSWLEEQAAARPVLSPPAAGPEELGAALGQAAEAVRRVADIVRDLREFSEPRAMAAGGCDLVAVLRHLQRLLGHEVTARALLRLDLPDAPLLVSAPPGRVGQLLASLLLHAAHSIEEGRAEVNEVHVSAHAEEEGMVVSVRDTGPSLPEGALAHLADPFHEAWATPGYAAGSRLALCGSLARLLHADLTAEGAPARGNAYRLRLPHLTSEARLSLGDHPRTRPRVLLVDDEPFVCASLYRVLSRSLDVVPHTSPHQALAVVRAGEPFEAVLCDLMMPEMSGVAFLQELWRLRPALAPRLVFLTGGAFTPAARESLERLPNLWVQKPTTLLELLATLAKIGVGGTPSDAANGPSLPRGCEPEAAAPPAEGAHEPRPLSQNLAPARAGRGESGGPPRAAGA